MAYSLDLREKVIKHRQTHTLQQTSDTFKIAKTTILDWERLLAETGSLEKRPLERGHKKIDPIALSEFILEFPDAYLHEIGEHFGASAPAVFYALENQSITLKKLKFVIVKQMKKNEMISRKLWKQ